MDEIRIGSVHQTGNLQNLKGDKKEGSNFENFLNDAVEKLKEVQKNAEMAVKELASGGDVTQAMISIEKADMSFQMMVEIRNRLLNAYEEIMRMQV
ncbi:MAG: flagellar hook-basal body complex protein FliE [Thermodesulfovibrionales bacterium]